MERELREFFSDRAPDGAVRQVGIPLYHHHDAAVFCLVLSQTVVIEEFDYRSNR